MKTIIKLNNEDIINILAKHFNVNKRNVILSYKKEKVNNGFFITEKNEIQAEIEKENEV